MKHIPNIISCLRILLIPLFVWQMLEGNLYAAGGILLASGLTDALDGFLARRFGWVSAVGKVLDPAADKLTQVTVCVVLALQYPHLWGFFAALLVKEVVMLTLGAYLLKKGAKIEGARWFGKVVTFLFYGTMLLLVVFPTAPAWLYYLLLGLTTLCALVSALLYIPDFLRYRRQAAAAKAGSQPEQ